MNRFPWTQGIVTLICAAILCGLGTWQIQRLAWKNAIIAKLESDYAAGLSGDVLSADQLKQKNGDKESVSYGLLEGRLLIDKAALVGPVPLEGRIGYQLAIPLALHDGTIILVNSGWVSELWKDNTQERLAILPKDTVRVRGVLRQPDYNRFASSNAPDKDLWFTLAPQEIAQSKSLSSVYNLVLYADHIEPPLPDVSVSESRWLPRNKHLHYAIFWYAMALVSIGVFGVYAWGQRKPKDES